MRLTGNAVRIHKRGTRVSHQIILHQKELGIFSAADFSAGWSGVIQPGKVLSTNLLFNVKSNGAALNNSQGKFKAANWQGKLQLVNRPILTVKGQFQTSGASAKISSGETLQSAAANITLLHQKSTFI